MVAKPFDSIRKIQIDVRFARLWKVDTRHRLSISSLGLTGEIAQMLEILVLVFVIGFCVSFANGANDVSKSMATLVDVVSPTTDAL